MIQTCYWSQSGSFRWSYMIKCFVDMTRDISLILVKHVWFSALSAKWLLPCRFTFFFCLQAPPRADVVKSLKNGIVVNLLGMGAAILGMQATVGLLVAKALTSSANPYYQGISPGYSPVLALDVFLVQVKHIGSISSFLLADIIFSLLSCGIYKFIRNGFNLFRVLIFHLGLPVYVFLFATQKNFI